MKAEEKAKELVSRFIESDNMVFNFEGAKECALIAVDLVIEYNDFHIEFLQEVKQEIEKL
jgi:hypothetical protein